MRINVTNKVVAVVAGLVDEGASMLDSKQGKSGFNTWQNWSRIGLAAVGMVAEGMGYFSKYAAPLADVETAFVTKTVVEAIRSKVGGGTTSAVITHSSGNPAAGAARKVGWRPMPVGV